jgi:hypothetical protein
MRMYAYRKMQLALDTMHREIAQRFRHVIFRKFKVHLKLRDFPPDNAG